MTVSGYSWYTLLHVTPCSSWTGSVSEEPTALTFRVGKNETTARSSAPSVPCTRSKAHGVTHYSTALLIFMPWHTKHSWRWTQNHSTSATSFRVCNISKIYQSTRRRTVFINSCQNLESHIQFPHVTSCTFVNYRHARTRLKSTGNAVLRLETTREECHTPSGECS